MCLVIVVFVAIGRRNHDEGSALTGLFETAAPFMIGLAAGWLAALAWRRPWALVTGLIVWPVTVLIGMVVRNLVFDRGIAASFVAVATIFLGLGIVGWRAPRSSRASELDRHRRDVVTPGVVGEPDRGVAIPYVFGAHQVAHPSTLVGVDDDSSRSRHSKPPRSAP